MIFETNLQSFFMIHTEFRHRWTPTPSDTRLGPSLPNSESCYMSWHEFNNLPDINLFSVVLRCEFGLTNACLLLVLQTWVHLCILSFHGCRTGVRLFLTVVLWTWNWTLPFLIQQCSDDRKSVQTNIAPCQVIFNSEILICQTAQVPPRNLKKAQECSKTKRLQTSSLVKNSFGTLRALVFFRSVNNILIVFYSRVMRGEILSI